MNGRSDDQFLRPFWSQAPERAAPQAGDVAQDVPAENIQSR